MGRRGRADEADTLVSGWAAVEVLEQARAAAEKHGDDVHDHLVDQVCTQVLLSRLGTAAHGDVLIARRRDGLLEAASMPSVAK